MPESTVFLDHLIGSRVINPLKQATAKHVNRFVILGRVQQGCLACGYTFGFRHPIGDELVLLAVGVAALPVLPNGEGVYKSSARRGLDRLEQAGQEGGQLVSCVRSISDLPQIDGEFVEENESGPVPEHLSNGLGTGRDTFLIGALQACVAFATAQRIGDLAPWGEGQNVPA